MAQILSQDEVDALLGGVGGSDKKDEPQGPGPDARPYDLTSQKRIVRGRMPGMDIINEKFARAMKNSLTNSLRRSVDFIPAGIEIMRYGDFLNTLQVPTNLNIYTMEPLEGHGLLVLEANLVFALVNCFFGGALGFHTKVEGREFTQIEQRVITGLVKTILRDYEGAWQSVHPLRLTYLRSEINPRAAAVAAQTESMTIHQFDVEMDGTTYKMFVGIPYPSLEPISDKIYNSFIDDQGNAGRWRAFIEKKLMESSVEVSVELGTVDITVRDLIGLQPGDVLQLQKKSDEPLDIQVEGVSRFLGRPGTMNGNQAIRVTGFFKRGSD